MMVYLRQLPLGYQCGELVFRQPEDMLRCFFERDLFISIDVVAIVLGESVHKEGTLRRAIQDDGAKTSGLAVAGARYALLDDAAAKVRIKLSMFGSRNRCQERRGRDALLAAETLEPGVLENPH